MSSQLTYTPLVEHNAICMLILEPSADPGSILRGRLIHTTLSEEPHYEALSYAWGKPIVSGKLRLESGTVELGENLVAALRQLRLEKRERTLWVDAICISQQHTAERSAQVEMGKSIV